MMNSRNWPANYIESTLKMHPEGATELGDHRFDGRLTDYSARSARERTRGAQSLLEQAEHF